MFGCDEPGERHDDQQEGCLRIFVRRRVTDVRNHGFQKLLTLFCPAQESFTAYDVV